jgi:hypothetical protein
MPEILPENPYNPGHAENCSLVEIDSSVISPLEGREGVYPRYARLVYMINSPSGGTGSNKDSHNKGWFKDYDALHEAYPTGIDGDHVILGSTNTIWIWDTTSNDWINSNRKGEVDSVNGYTGVVVLNATDISSNVAGLQSNDVESALSELNTKISQNTSKITNISTQDTTTSISGTLNVVENGAKIITNDLDTASITISNGEEVTINQFNKIIDSSASDNGLPTSKAVYTAIQSSVKFTPAIEVSITPTEAKIATPIPDAQTKPAKVMVIPKLANIGAVYIREGASSQYSGINPIYPDPTNNMYEFANLSDVRIFVDNVGDSTDLIINYKE